jgi:hypothetical protein
MFKYLFLTIILTSCSNNDSKTTQSGKIFFNDSPRLISASDTSVLKTRRLFDNQKPFQVILGGNRIEHTTSDKDTVKCESWTLTTKQVIEIIKNSQTIDGTQWDLAFGFLACSVYGTIVQDSIEYPFTVNAGSHALVNNGDTTIIYGDYAKKDKRYFLSSPQE